MTDASSHSMQDSINPTEPAPNFIKWLRENCVPIVGTISAALVLCLVAHYSSTTIDWARTKDFSEVFANVTQTLALMAGGVWAYFKFVKGRTFEDRLTPTVNGKFVSINGSVYLIVTTLLENVSLSRIVLDLQVHWSSSNMFRQKPRKFWMSKING